MPISMQHPNRHVWDFWYHFDREAQLFHIFYLNADRALVALGQHHYAACVGHATTVDFVAIDWGNESRFDVLKPPSDHWANTCIWSGDVIKVKTGYLMFYTSRDSCLDDGMTQSIGVAHTSDLSSDQWHFWNTQLRPKLFYQPRGLADDLTIHAWRDPFLLRHRDRGEIFMLVSAKALDGPIGRRGVVALLRVAEDRFAQAVRGDSEWDYLPPIFKPGCYSEMEVPQLYRQGAGGYELVFSCWAKYDFSPRGLGGFQGVTLPDLGAAPAAFASHGLAPDQELYACRIVPELGGEIVGFDVQAGGIRRSGIKTSLVAVDRDFSDLVV